MTTAAKTGPVLRTEFPGVDPYARGKVRDIYDLGEHLLIVTTDRISAYDSILPTPIPDKGRVLTAMSIFWFDHLKDIVPNHFVTADVAQYPEPYRNYPELLAGRSMIVKKCSRIDYECVVRGYISGSLWKEYEGLRTGATESVAILGLTLPGDLTESDELPEPIFTPATKADDGHDINVAESVLVDDIGAELTGQLREVSITLYTTAAAYARERGIIIADTKFEFGFDGDTLTLIDEVLSPDSSRFWRVDEYSPGRGQKSFDKQFVRDYLTSLDWDRNPPAPPLSGEVAQQTAARYREAQRVLTAG